MDTIAEFVIALVLIWAIVNVLRHRHDVLLEIANNKPKVVKEPYLPESVIYLLGGHEETVRIGKKDVKGWGVTFLGHDVFMSEGQWYYYQNNPMQPSYKQWLKTHTNKIVILIADHADEVYRNQQNQPQPQSPVVVPITIATQGQPQQPQMRWPKQQDPNTGKRIANVSLQQAEAWYADDYFGWDTDPNERGLWLPDGYLIRKDKNPNSLTTGKWVVDKRKP